MIEGVPVLVLDCENDIDIVGDEEAKASFVADIKSYYKYVKDLKHQMGLLD